MARLMGHISESDISQRVAKRFSTREEAEYSSDEYDEEKKKWHWTDYILSIFWKKTKVEYYGWDGFSEDDEG